ncbi:signal peptidase I [Vagococcus humatus]|uniref:Signal peptidase I n=1 Tax=Vagococcus humatus TaxID=1889241 RepID=A0A3S0ACH7_9ENTE|nr:signal peptidase I [Vagococcus humatus]RST89633.1 signal peptidase I [Vagococcus humatus]
MNAKTKEIVGNIVWFVALVAIVLGIRFFIMHPVQVSGHSMDPTLEDRQRIIAFNSTDNIKRFDIVTFPAPDDPGKSYIKRVIGLPGDEIEYRNDELFINGKRHDEPYLDAFKKKLDADEWLTYYVYEGTNQATTNFSLEDLQACGTKKVPKGSLFVLGDNRQNSKDSRYIGYIKIKDVSGDVKFSIWPPRKFGTVK